ncbi:MAG TPA: UDP-3-O-(3-hydroxymyristoyl)glucosamine N-acyltransferase, partial [Phaeodactylibacter sp.]|nr:UDP-3-O-(3-hydroxymyristoyl)glucosamine N-acyltransferase [Phaeodactylibacter sp.]
MQKTALELATFLDGSIEGRPDVVVFAPSKIEEAQEGTITFLANAKYEDFLYTTRASVVIVDREFVPKQTINPTLIRVDDVYAAIAKILAEFAPVSTIRDISPHAVIADDVSLGQHVGIGAFASIHQGVRIGNNCSIHDQVYLGKDVSIGEGTIIYPGVRILANCKIGNFCIIHSNAVIGSDGFGYAPKADGSYQKITHVGNVII